MTTQSQGQIVKISGITTRPDLTHGKTMAKQLQFTLTSHPRGKSARTGSRTPHTTVLLRKRGQNILMHAGIIPGTSCDQTACTIAGLIDTHDAITTTSSCDQVVKLDVCWSEFNFNTTIWTSNAK